MKLTEEQRLSRAHLAIVNHIKHCAIGGVVMFGKTSVVDDVPTACTDGFNTRYGRKFLQMLDEPELRFLVLHENYHKAFRHLTTWAHLHHEDATLANIACDHVINLMLTDLDNGEGFIKMPSKVPGPCDPQFKGMDAGQVFRLLQKKGDKQGGGGKGDKQGGGGKGDKQGDDGPSGFDSHDWDGAKEMSAEKQAEVARQIDQALRQGAILASKRGGKMDRSLTDLLEPKINWREVLREFVTAICSGRDMSTWRKVNRRLVDSDIYMPGCISESVGRIVVGIDTSGSIGEAELREFLSEVVGVAKQITPEVLDLIYWDARVAAHEKYGVHELDGLEIKTKPAGGGGTAPSCVTAYLHEQHIKPECVIMLTDGYVGNDWGGSWPCPVLWVVTSKGVTAPVGKTVHL